MICVTGSKGCTLEINQSSSAKLESLVEARSSHFKAPADISRIILKMRNPLLIKVRDRRD